MSWENATENSRMVRETAEIIDMEIALDHKRKKRRTMAFATMAYAPEAPDSENDDGADDDADESGDESPSIPDSDSADDEFTEPEPAVVVKQRQRRREHPHLRERRSPVPRSALPSGGEREQRVAEGSVGGAAWHLLRWEARHGSCWLTSPLCENRGTTAAAPPHATATTATAVGESAELAANVGGVPPAVPQDTENS
eukprot:CAMPEP_0180184134 /NCGR_PEP_ID=MMETSP0986-20121125/41650_1 /TAXON_ID=697907 /ORGANISM="non described non described, Strain CCMP2293" /LENGTH=197 /DNA_ID=CAMNT_0022137775 /DNA_START=1175 /DNA_END=1766 /DNA_ORIENTATION=+